MARTSDQKKRSQAGGGYRTKAVPTPRPNSLAPTPLRLRQRRRRPTGRPASPPSIDLGRLEPRSGLPVWAIGVGGVTFLCLVVTTLAGATKWSFAVFVGALVGAAMGVGHLVAFVARDKTPLRAARAGAVIILAAVLPVVFDPHTGDVFNLPKFTVMVIGSLVLVALWVVAIAGRTEAPDWRNGLHWAVAALVAWTLISALAGMDTHVSLLGNYGSYDGFYSAACFGVMFTVAAQALGPDDARPAAAAVLIGSGSVVVIYGLVQLHDTEVHGSVWDFINWHSSSFTGDIFSTFGNPNHLGGFLAMALPAVLVFGVGAPRRTRRVAAGALCLATLAELVRTSARGAWVATILSMAVLAIGLAPEVRRHIRLYAGTAAGVVAIAALAMAAGGDRFLSHKLSTLFQTSGGSSIWQRFEIWRSAVHIAGDHPLTGIGPDNFALIYPRYQSAAWVRWLGPNYLVNGAHDIFMNFLADEGPLGLALWLLVLALIGKRCVTGWRKLRREEVDAEDNPGQFTTRRLTLSVLAAAMTAYLVQAAFNVQQIGLTEVFWVLAGCAFAVTAAPGPVGVDARRQTRAPKRGAQRSGGTPFIPLVTVVACVAGVVVVGIFADAPYRADHDYWAAYRSVEQARAPGVGGTNQVGPTFFNDLSLAMSLNPAEPTYPFNEAVVDSSLASHATSVTQARTALLDARTAALKAASAEPLWGVYSAAAAQIDLELARLEGKVPAAVRQYLASANAMATQAVADNPRNSSYAGLLNQVHNAMKANT